MTTLEHGGLVEMFRENPSLAPHLLQTLFHIDVPPHAFAGTVESTLDQLGPVEFRADLVVELRDDSGRVVLSIIVEVQRGIDLDKLFSWPVYLAVERSRKRCPAVVLVVAVDAAIATWSSESIDLGLGLSSVRPIVLGPSAVPEITTESAASQEVELAVLSAVTHGNGPKGVSIVVATLAALGRLDQEHAAVYFQIIYDALREPVRRAVEQWIMERQTQVKTAYPPFIQQFVDQGKLQGVREGKLQGVREGKLEGKRETLLRQLVRAKITLTEDERARIEACTDDATLDRWLDNVVGAETAADVLA